MKPREKTSPEERVLYEKEASDRTLRRTAFNRGGDPRELAQVLRRKKQKW